MMLTNAGLSANSERIGRDWRNEYFCILLLSSEGVAAEVKERETLTEEGGAVELLAPYS